MPADIAIAADPGVPGEDPVRLRLQILGPVRVWRLGVEVAVGPAQQATLLAVLLARVGRPTTTDELIETIWGEAPPQSALNTIHKYIGTLRRLLEPEIPARGAGSLLQRRGDFYLCVADQDTLDLVAFRALVRQARDARADGRDANALDAFGRALAVWRGPAGAGLARRTSTMAIFALLNAEFVETCAAATELALALGQPERVLTPLRAAAAIEPFHEPLHAHLINALGAAGQQGAAMEVFQAIRTRLVSELGLDPGEALRAAHRRLLDSSHPSPSQRFHSAGSDGPGPVAMVGRIEQLATLWTAAESALTGSSGIAVLEGEPGIGKTRLLEAVGVEAARRNMLVVWGRCVEGKGAPVLWPWVQITGSILQSLSPATRSTLLTDDLGSLIRPDGDVFATPVLPDTGARFRLFERITAVIGGGAAQCPTLILVDDIQWADQASLQMLEHVATRLPGGSALVCALRNRAPKPPVDLVRLLASLSRAANHRRVGLESLSPDETIELVHHEIGVTLAQPVGRTLYDRSGGNPFFALELGRLLVSDEHRGQGRVDHLGVPSTVRDVVLDRMDGLEGETVALLQVAAAVGDHIDVGILALATGFHEQSCLDRLQAVEELGLIRTSPAHPRAFRFAHDLVRESVVEATPISRRPQIHLDVANALEERGAAHDLSVELFAHHLWSAGPLADPTRTVEALVRAGRTAAVKGGFESAERQLHAAAEIARTAGLAQLELDALAHLIAAVGMRAGYVGASRQPLERAERLARDLGRDREAADLLFSRYCGHSQGIELVQAGRLARRLLHYGEASTDPIVRAYGWAAWGIHQSDLGNIEDAQRHLAQANTLVLMNDPEGGGWQLRRDLQLLWPVWFAFATALHGDLDAARGILDEVDAAAEDDPYAITVWATFSAVMGALAGDAAGVISAATRGIATDPEWSYGFLGSYQRLGLCWARAMLGDQPSRMATEAEQIIATMEDPPRSGLSTWCCLVAEMRLMAGDLDAAALALDKVDRYLTGYGQRYAEGLLLLLRAQLMLARGVPAGLVSSAAQRARAVSIERGAHLFAQRAETFLADLKADGSQPSSSGNDTC